MSESKELYIWLEGDFKTPPKIEVKVAPQMSLNTFKDKYVDTQQSHLVMHVYAATDDEGNNYAITLTPAEAHASKDNEAINGTTLVEIKGIGDRYMTSLKKAGITSVEDLAKAGTTPAKRARLAKKIKRNEKVVLQWVQLADLMRIKGINRDYSTLLWEAGITAPSDLPNQHPERLLQLLARTNEEKKAAPQLPTVGQISEWIEQAEELPVLIKE